MWDQSTFFSISRNFLFRQSRNLVSQNFLKRGHEVRAHSTTTHYEAAFSGSTVLYFTWGSASQHQQSRTFKRTISRERPRLKIISNDSDLNPEKCRQNYRLIGLFEWHKEWKNKEIVKKSYYENYKVLLLF